MLCDFGRREEFYFFYYEGKKQFSFIIQQTHSKHFMYIIIVQQFLPHSLRKWKKDFQSGTLKQNTDIHIIYI